MSGWSWSTPGLEANRVLGISSRAFAWSDLHAAFSLAVDAWGFALIEFDTAQIRDDQYSEIGLLTQRFGASVSLYATLDLTSGAPGSIVGELDRLRERCGEALAQEVVLSLAVGDFGVRDWEEVLRPALPGYEAAGLGLGLEVKQSPGWLDPSAPPALHVWLKLEPGTGPIQPPLTAARDRLGGVRVACRAGEPLCRDALQRIAATGFRGPYVVAPPEPMTGHPPGDPGRWIREATRDLLGGR